MAVALGSPNRFGLPIVGPAGPAALAFIHSGEAAPSTRVSLQWICPMSTKKLTKKRPANEPAPVKAARATRPKKAKNAAPKASLARGAKRALSPLEVQLRRALAEMGLARARRVFAAVEASFDE